MRKKVLYFTNIPVPYRMDFFNELGKYCDLTVLMENEDVDNLNEDWMKAHTVKNYTYILLPKIGKKSNTRINYGYAKIIKEGNFDHIIVGTYYSLSAMVFIQFLRINKIPFILNSDGGFIKKDRTILKKIKTHFISSAAHYISTGVGTSNYLIHYGAKKENIYTIPFTTLSEEDVLKNPVCSQDKIRIRNGLGIKEDKVLIYVGQFIYRKGVDNLLKALKYSPKEIGVYIVGGKVTEEYERLANESENQNIHFIEFLGKKDLLEYYKAADIFVLPTREDIWGLVVNEAMSMGLPVISTKQCLAALELVGEGKNGWIYDANDWKKLAQIITEAFSEETVLEKMQYESLSTIKRYTIENMAIQHIHIMDIIDGDLNK